MHKVKNCDFPALLRGKSFPLSISPLWWSDVSSTMHDSEYSSSISQTCNFSSQLHVRLQWKGHKRHHCIVFYIHVNSYHTESWITTTTTTAQSSKAATKKELVSPHMSAWKIAYPLPLMFVDVMIVNRSVVNASCSFSKEFHWNKSFALKSKQRREQWTSNKKKKERNHLSNVITKHFKHFTYHLTSMGWN